MRGWKATRTHVLAPGGRVTGPLVITSNADVSLDTILLIVSVDPVIFLAMTLSVLVEDKPTLPKTSDPGSSASPVAR